MRILHTAFYFFDTIIAIFTINVVVFYKKRIIFLTCL
jgi:hypothetical protein